MTYRVYDQDSNMIVELRFETIEEFNIWFSRQVEEGVNNA